MLITTETVNPEKAESLLTANIGNRNPTHGNILKYARDMANGRWKQTGDTIKFDKNGVLIDGQNRLMAVIESGATIDFLVVRDLDPDSKMSTDIGVPRSISHMLTFSGEKNVTTLSSIARIAILHERGVIGRTANSNVLSIAEVMDYINCNPKIRDAAAFTTTNRELRALLSPSTMGFVRFVTTQISESMSDDFFSHIDVTPASRNHPCRILKESIYSAKISAKRGSSVSGLFRVAITIKAWNAFSEKREISLLRWSKTESFPKFSGYKYSSQETN